MALIQITKYLANGWQNFRTIYRALTMTKEPEAAILHVSLKRIIWKHYQRRAVPSTKYWYVVKIGTDTNWKLNSLFLEWSKYIFHSKIFRNGSLILTSRQVFDFLYTKQAITLAETELQRFLKVSHQYKRLHCVQCVCWLRRWKKDTIKQSTIIFENYHNRFDT